MQVLSCNALLKTQKGKKSNVISCQQSNSIFAASMFYYSTIQTYRS